MLKGLEEEPEIDLEMESLEADLQEVAAIVGEGEKNDEEIGLVEVVSHDGLGDEALAVDPPVEVEAETKKKKKKVQKKKKLGR